MSMIKVTAPLTKKQAKTLRAGDAVLLTGVIYTARDAAHKRLCALLDEGKPLPFDIENAVIYYVGPSPAKPGYVTGAAGPTTSCRMDAYAPRLLALGQTGMIGKGARSEEVRRSMVENGAVYFGSTGGAAALTAGCIKKSELICYEDLGSEAVRRLWVEDMPLTVVIDSYGENLYVKGREEYLKQCENSLCGVKKG